MTEATPHAIIRALLKMKDIERLMTILQEKVNAQCLNFVHDICK